MGSLAGVNVQSGNADLVVGAVGSGVTYYHNVRIHIQIQGRWVPFVCYAGFLDGLNQFGAGLLGHNGFFDLFESIVFDTINGTVELKLP